MVAQRPHRFPVEGLRSNTPEQGQTAPPLDFGLTQPLTSSRDRVHDRIWLGCVRKCLTTRQLG
jgi:hypothetical protein